MMHAWSSVLVVVAFGCRSASVVVGIADPSVDASDAAELEPLVPARPGPHPAATMCPQRPDVTEKLGELDAVEELLRFAATDQHLVYAARTRDGARTTVRLRLVDRGAQAVVLDETIAPWRGGILVDDDRAYWSPDGVRRAFFAPARGAPLRLFDDVAFTVHRLAPADVLVPTPAGGARILGDGPAARALWLNVPDDDPAGWAVTRRHAYWLSSQALYRASFQALTQQAALPGPLSGGITADERRVYWVETSGPSSRLRALDGEDLDKDPVTVGTLAEELATRGLRATRTAVFVLSVRVPKASLYRFDLATGEAKRVTTFPEPVELAFPPVLTACSVVYRSGREFFQRPLL